MRHSFAWSVLVASLICLTGVAVAQDIPAEISTTPTMQDVLNGLGSNSETPAVETKSVTESAPTLSTDDSEPQPEAKAPPMESMNPAFMPKPTAPAPNNGVEPPQAEGSDTPPVPAKPPAYNAQPFVVLQTLDKVTARTGTMTVKVGDTIAVGPLFLQVKTCQQAAPLETPDSAAFLQVWEAKPKDGPADPRDKGPSQWVFSGWMFASSPALSAMDHPIYDIWVLSCQANAKKTEKPAPDSDTKPVEKPVDKPVDKTTEKDTKKTP